jgi:tetratricopeptide (TPR) repeat protein
VRREKSEWLALAARLSIFNLNRNQNSGAAMANYVWTIKDATGQTIVKEVEAGSAREAQSMLLAQGYTDLELKEDEVSAAAVAGFKAPVKFLGEEMKVTAADRLKVRENFPTTFTGFVFWAIKQSAGLFLLLALLAIFMGYRGHTVSACLIVGAAIIWVLFFVLLAAPSVYYKKMIKAADWHRWEEVSSLIRTLRVTGKFGFIKVPDSELVRYEAKVLAGQGHLDEGLKLYQKCEGRVDCPTWLYKSLVASICNTAKAYDRAIESQISSLAINPRSTGWLDVANYYARYKRNPAKAREALAEAEKEPIVDLAKPSLIRTRGIIAYLEGDLAGARRDLETAIDQVEKAKTRPFRDGHLSVARAYLCCVLVKQGEMAAAKKNFELAKDYLIATQEDELLAECRRLLVAPG